MMGSDEHRAALGFLSVEATRALGGRGVRVLDPNSTLIARSAVVGASTVIYPGVIISSDEVSMIRVGERCTLYPGCVLEARQHGQILIGDEVELGPGGATIRVAGGAEVMVLEDLVRARSVGQ